MRPGPIPAAAVALLISFGGGGAAAAQTSPDPIRVSSVTMTASLVPGREDVEVRLAYALERDPDAAPAPVRLRVLEIGNTEIHGARIELPGSPGGPRGQPLDLSQVQGALRSASLDMGAETGTEVVLSYRVAAGAAFENGGVRIRLPLLTLDLPQVGTTRSTFLATIEVPEEWRMGGTFPSGLTSTAPGVWSGDLQVIPSFVALRGRTDGRWRPGLPWALDVATVLILAVVSFTGWRHLSGVVREARA